MDYYCSTIYRYYTFVPGLETCTPLHYVYCRIKLSNFLCMLRSLRPAKVTSPGFLSLQTFQRLCKTIFESYLWLLITLCPCCTSLEHHVFVPFSSGWPCRLVRTSPQCSLGEKPPHADDVFADERAYNEIVYSRSG